MSVCVCVHVCVCAYMWEVVCYPVCVCVSVCVSVCDRCVCVQHKNRPIRQQGSDHRESGQSRSSVSGNRKRAALRPYGRTDGRTDGQPESVGHLCNALQKAGVIWPDAVYELFIYET